MSTLKTAREIVMLDSPIVPHVIPPIVDPMGRHWRQPNRFDIEIDETHAMMSQRSFDQLAEYSCSQPTGVYPGKMWKCHVGIYAEPQWPEEKRYWLLRWFGLSERGPDWCSNHCRRIIVV